MLISTDGKIKIADFGFALVINEFNTKYIAQVGCVEHLAPELITRVWIRLLGYLVMHSAILFLHL